jgi:hypothetical protein
LPEIGELGKPRDRGLALPIELGDLRLGILDCGIQIDGHRCDSQDCSGLNRGESETWAYRGRPGVRWPHDR